MKQIAMVFNKTTIMSLFYLARLASIIVPISKRRGE